MPARLANTPSSVLLPSKLETRTVPPHLPLKLHPRCFFSVNLLWSVSDKIIGHIESTAVNIKVSPEVWQVDRLDISTFDVITFKNVFDVCEIFLREQKISSVCLTHLMCFMFWDLFWKILWYHFYMCFTYLMCLMCDMFGHLWTSGHQTIRNEYRQPSRAIS